MKRMFTAFVLFLAALSVYGQSNRPVHLDAAIMVAAERIDGRIEAGSKIAVLNFNSPTERFSSYVLSELSVHLVDSKVLEVVGRRETDLIREELNFQYAGEVDARTREEAGRMLGAQSIVSGSLMEIDGAYRFEIIVYRVQSNTEEVRYRTNIENNDLVKSLLGITRPPKTSAEKIGTGALNVIFGLGSYLEGDLPGGLTVTAGYAVAAGLFAIEAVALDWDSSMVGVPATAGVVVAGLAITYGFIRPFIHNQAPGAVAVLDSIKPGIVLTSDTNTGKSSLGIQLSYTTKF